jgi:calcium-translocating P-type ATPase
MTSRTPAWHSLTVAEVLRMTHSTVEGLSSREAGVRLKTYGSNRLPDARSAKIVVLFLRQFLSPLIYILLAAAVFSLWSGERNDALFIFAVLLINAIIGTAQEYMAERAAMALKGMVPVHAAARRNGQLVTITAEQLVPGDIVLLASGDKIPADIRFVETTELRIDESMLTGESLPVAKQADIALPEETPMADRQTLGFAGSLVSRGRGMGVVVATGAASEIGRIASNVGGREKIKPPLLARIDQFSLRLTLVMLAVIGILVAVAILRGHSPLMMIPVAIALAVAAVPEGMPAAITVALAVGMRRMARHHVIIRRMAAVETLGSCTYIASDKTGTLTRNEITVERVMLPDGTGFLIEGDRISVENGESSAHHSLQSLVRAGVLANEASSLRKETGWEHTGDKVDISLLVFGRKWGLAREEALTQHKQLSILPYESERGFSAALHADAEDSRLFVKGSLEKLLPMCRHMQCDGRPVPLDTESIEAQMEALAKQGYRVLAFADAGIAAGTDIDNPQALLHGLTFLGLAGMIDPLRPEAKEAVAQCHAAGIRVAMITGDHPVTALAIARQLGLVDGAAPAITGQMVDAAKNREALWALVEQSTVFARIAPEQKRRIVECLVAHGHCVAVTGDGVNDAPALKAAHVGVAMGRRGTDVARESAEIVLADDNFASVVAGIREGRIVYANIRKVIFHFVSIGMAEILLFLLAIGFGLPMPLTTVQLLWLNLVTGGMQDLPLTLEKAEGGELLHKPRPVNEPIFNRLMIRRVALNAIFIGGAAFGIFYWLLAHDYSETAARNIVLLLMVLFENAQVLNSRSETKSLFGIPLFRNPLLLVGMLLAQTVHVIAMYVPLFQRMLAVEPVHAAAWLWLLAVTLLLLAVNEVDKLRHGRSRVEPGVSR